MTRRTCDSTHGHGQLWLRSLAVAPPFQPVVEKVEGVWLAAETRVYLDAFRDPRRGAEQAREYRSQVFGF